MESGSDDDSTDDKVVHVSSSAKVQIHEFASLTTESNAPHNINKINLLGHKWILQLFPGGVSGAKEGWISMFIHRETASVDDISVELKFIVKNVGEEKMTYNFREFRGSTLHLGKGSYNFALRSKVLESLGNNSSLVVEVNMKLIDPIEPSLPFVPENPAACEVIRGMWGDAASANVTIGVGGRQFHAHRFILEKCSTTLAGLLESAGDQTAHIQISDVSADIFHLLHKYMYGHTTIFDDVSKSRSNEVIDAADKYGIVTLKFEAEAVLVEATIFTMENVMELMQYAESKNCSLLKEAALDYIALNKVEAIMKLSFNNAPGTIAKDILVAVSRGEKNEDELSTMRISELRRMAHSKRLIVDGSREVLIAALKRQKT